MTINANSGRIPLKPPVRLAVLVLMLATGGVAVAALLPLPVSFAQAVSFSPATNFAVGSDPHSVAIGDLDGDRKPDLAVANFGDNNVSVLLGDGTGAFVAATPPLAVGLRPFDAEIGDLDGDGDADLAVPNRDSNNVSILLGTGTGAFGAAANFPAGTFPDDVVIGDLNSDGKPDLAVSNFTIPGTVSILLGTGTGSFGPVTQFVVGSLANALEIGDLNGDGKLDLAVTNSFSNQVFILPGTGTGPGLFGPVTPVDAGPVGAYAYKPAIGDLNSDGKPDLAVVSRNTATVSILLRGAGSFGSPINFSTGGIAPFYGYFVAIGDLNVDGKPDLALANISNDNVEILLGTGNGSFGAGTPFAVGTEPEEVAIGDLNRDGKLDLAVTNVGSANASILINTTLVVEPRGQHFCIFGSSTGVGWTWTLSKGLVSYTGTVPIGTVTALDPAAAIAAAWVGPGPGSMIGAGVAGASVLTGQPHCFRHGITPPVGWTLTVQTLTGPPCMVTVAANPNGCSFNPTVIEVIEEVAVGGIVELVSAPPDSPQSQAASSGPSVPYAAIAGGAAAAVLAVAAGGWYARRRRLG